VTSALRALRDRSHEITRTVAGQVDHMAPEQVAAAPLDERSDLFCAGILLWELLVGRPLFRRENQAATLFAVSRAEVPPPSSVDAALARWDRVCLKALARPPTARHRSARELSEEIRALIGDVDNDRIAGFLSTLPAVPSASQSSLAPSPSARDDVDTVVDHPRGPLLAEEASTAERAGAPSAGPTAVELLAIDATSRPTVIGSVI
jgi:serine/threonine-protein kinase